MYAIDINFNNSICYLNELTKLFRAINWEAIEPGITLHYSSYSRVATYDFIVENINHGYKWVSLAAINNTRAKLLRA